MNPIKQPKAKFGELIVKAGIITAEQLEEALRQQSDGSPWRTLGEILVGMHTCTEEDIERILEVQGKLRNGGYDAAEAIRQSCSEDTVNHDINELRALAERKG